MLLCTLVLSQQGLMAMVAECLYYCEKVKMGLDLFSYTLYSEVLC